MEKDLNRDMGVLAAYMQKWYFKLSLGEKVTTAFHLNNREARRELDMFVNNMHLEFQAAPKYLGIRMVDPWKQSLPRKTRTTLVQLHSGYSRTLASYLSRIDHTVKDECLDCG